MSTIKDTITEICEIQKEFEKIDSKNYLISELNNITAVIYFDYLSHTILDQSRAIDLTMINGSTKYYNLFSNEELLSEYIRINNIGQLFIVWISYEKYLRDKYRKDYGLEKFKIKDVFDDLINKNNPKNKIQIIEEFEIIRNTRNSLHDGGIYNINFSHFKGKLCNKEYIFTPGSSVKPLRIIDVIKTIWSQYKELEKINN